jgi:enamidase
MHRITQAALTLAAFAALSASALGQMDWMDAVGTPPAKLPPSVVHAEPVIAFTHAQIVDGTGAAPRRDMTLISDHGRIAALGPSAKVKIPAGAAILDMHGKTLLPGFVMVHEHLFYPLGQGNYDALLNSFPALYLAGGTTTMRTGGTVAPDGDLNLAAAIGRGEAIGPDIDVTAPYLNGPGQPIYKMHVLKDAADATRTVNYWADEGATSFKAYMTISRDELAAAVIAAHAHGLKITGHLCSITYREAVERGIDNLEHGFAAMTDFVADKKPDVCPDRSIESLANLDIHGKEIKSLIDLLVAHHVALTSTLTVFETFTPGRPEAPEAARAMLIPELRADYENAWTKAQTAGRYTVYTTVFPKLMQLERMFAAAGGTLLAGTDPTGFGGVIPGFSGKRQIELLVEAGFTFPQALQIATLNGARYLGRDKEVGSLAVGKRADIVVIDGDPMRDATALERMPLVFKAGLGYKSDSIFDAFRGKVGLY